VVLLTGQHSCGILTHRIMVVLLTGQHSCGILTHRIMVVLLTGSVIVFYLAIIKNRGSFCELRFF